MLGIQQGELRIALRMAYDALQGKPLPDVARQPSASLSAAARAGSGAAALPPVQQQPAAGVTQRTGPLSPEDMDAQIARFQVQSLGCCAHTHCRHQGTRTVLLASFAASACTANAHSVCGSPLVVGCRRHLRLWRRTSPRRRQQSMMHTLSAPSRAAPGWSCRRRGTTFPGQTCR
jgi:hypothetical protein